MAFLAVPGRARRELQKRYALESNREVPAWGAAIFSPLCVIMRPESPEDLGRFLKYCLALTQLHVQVGGMRRGGGVGVWLDRCDVPAKR